MKDKNVQTKINIHVDKLPEISFWNLKQHKYLIALNVHEAYDSVMLYILDQFIQNDPYFTNSEKEEWQEEVKDLIALNMDITGNIMYSSQGIPQDSELAPDLLNYYMSRILEDPIITKLTKECEITIYSDNIFIVNNFDNEEMCTKLVVDLNNAFNKYNLSFNSEYRIIKIGGFSFSNGIKNINELDNYQSRKLSGIKFSSIYNHRKILNSNKSSFKLKYIFLDPFYKMINIAKRYIFAKLNFYIILLYTKYLKEDYKDWSKREFRNWLKASLVIVKIPDNMIEYILVNIEKFSYLDYDNIIRYFYWFNELKIEFIIENNDKILNNIRELIIKNKSKNYISKNILINEVFNFNKNKSKNIFKNQKIT